MITRTRYVIIVLGLLFSMTSVPFKLPFINLNAGLVGGVFGVLASAVVAVIVSKNPHLQNNVVFYAGSNFDRDGLAVTMLNPKYNVWFWLAGLSVGLSLGLHLSAVVNYLYLYDFRVAVVLGTYAVCCCGGFIAYFVTENVITFRNEAFDLFQGGDSFCSLNTFTMSLLAGLGFGEFGGTLCGAYGFGFMIAYSLMYECALYIGLWNAGILIVAFCVLTSILQCIARMYLKREYTKLPLDGQVE
mmetsp:Transcript_19810/g.36573  ORF Transcript_19810/g.36573 Transcript_19810/m.36573 type:complete len:244 (+) Transcript_19810:976-1707(+)